MSKKISTERKTAYYLGIAITGLGFLIFLSFFLSAAGVVGNGGPGNFPRGFSGTPRPSFGTPVIGITMIIVGQFISKVGARGLAGSGILLDPKKAREDLEPYSRMGGGMVKDALEESGVPEMLQGSGEAKIMIRCRACEKLNEEDSNFCQECGKPV